MGLLKKLESLEGIVIKHNDLIEKESRNLKNKHSINSSQKIKDEINQIEDENRLLQIGIVGRVKAGKSSLLNSLVFDGKSILPKAATPMTAALTVISYADKPSVEIEFFSKNDIENIKNDSLEYEKEFSRLLKEKENESKKRKIVRKIDINKLKERVTRELNKIEPSLSSSYDQYQRMQKSNIAFENLEKTKAIPLTNIESLGSKLKDYVGADGRFMPFTKSVHIKIPQDNLKNIQIVDTPGVNDPVVSREDRTRELLKFCDVVFIVSPAGQFMSKEDLDLMDRITSKEGVRELFVVASKCDTQLYGSIKEESQGNLDCAFDSIVTSLAGSLHNTLSNLKKSNPEVGDVYDKLIYQSKSSIVHSSGISHTIKEAYDNQDVLDSGEAHAWKLLVDNYPNHFSKSNKELTIPNLDLLSNIKKINKIINDDVRKQKDEILSQRKNEFLNAKIDSFNKYKSDLIEFIEERIKDINSNDIDKLKAERTHINYIKSNISKLIDEEYDEQITELDINIYVQLKKKLNSYFRKGSDDIDNEEEVKTRSYEVSTFTWDWDKIVNPSTWFGSKTVTETYTKIRAGAVKDSLSNLTTEIEEKIKSISVQKMAQWRIILISRLEKILKNNINDKNFNTKKINRIVRNTINNVEFPLLSYNNISLPSGSGTLKKSKADNFIKEVRKYWSTLEKQVIADIKKYTDSLIENLEQIKLSEKIFSEYDASLKELENQIQNKAIIINELNKCKTSIKEI